MAANRERLIEQRVRSPRSAAIAGIVFSLLQGAIIILVSTIASPEDIGVRPNTISFALALVPFAGIAFLWFTGVVRDRLGEWEDKFFATIFLGSGILFVGMMFVWAATFGAIFQGYAAAAELSENNDVSTFGFAFMNEIVGNYALRVAGVYMISIATLWTKSGVMPRWITILTYILALGFLFFAQSVREIRFVFPAWVLLVSIYILISNFRHSHNQETN